MKDAVLKFKEAHGSGRVAMLFGLLNNVSIKEKDRIEMAYAYLSAIPEKERNALYPGPVRSFYAFQLTRQFILLDYSATTRILDKLLTGDKELLTKCMLQSRNEVLRFIEHMIGRCHHKLSPRLQEYAQTAIERRDTLSHQRLG